MTTTNDKKMLVDASLASDLEVARVLAARVASETSGTAVARLAKTLDLVEREQSFKEYTREWLKENSLYGDVEVGSTLTALVAKIYKEHGDGVSGDTIRRRFNELMDGFHGTHTVTFKSYEYDEYVVPALEKYAASRSPLRKTNLYAGALLEHLSNAKVPDEAAEIRKAIDDALAELQGMVSPFEATDAQKREAKLVQKAFGQVPIVKAESTEDERYVLGIVLEPEVVDAHKDIYSAEEIRKAAYKFMEEYRTIGLQHKYDVSESVKILESYIAPTDLTIGETTVKKGTWMLAVRVNDGDLWDDIKEGRMTGFSIGGSAVRVEVK